MEEKEASAKSGNGDVTDILEGLWLLFWNMFVSASIRMFKIIQIGAEQFLKVQKQTDAIFEYIYESSFPI